MIDPPPDVAYVLEHKGVFTPQTDAILEGVAPGTVIDDLAGFSGCWGYYLVVAEEVPGPIHLVSVLDAESGVITEWVREDLLGVLPVGYMSEGSFQVVADSRIMGSTTEIFSTGGLPSDPMPEEPFDWAVTLSGDRLIVADWGRQGADDGVAGLTYVRFDCTGGKDHE